MANARTQLDAALAHHRAGRLDAAEAGYREILANDPASADALHLLGVVEFARGRHMEALALLQRAIAIRPAAEIFGNLGPVLAALGRGEEARAAYRRAIALRPVYPEAYNNLAKLLYSQGDVEDAITAFRSALQQSPRQAGVWNNLGLVLRGCKRNGEAIDAFRQAIEVNPRLADAHNNLGIALQAEGQIAEAIAACEAAVRCNRSSAECLNSLGNAYQAQGRLDDAVDAYRHALEIRPDLVETHNNLGNALRSLGRLEEAIGAYRAGLARRPDAPEVLSNLGNTLQTAGDLDGAIATFEQALRLRPDLNFALSNLGNALKERGELDAALDCFQRAIDQNPEQSVAFSNRLFTLAFHPGFSSEQILAAHVEYGRRYVDRVNVLSPIARPVDRTPNRRLRVGYVSPNFKDHCQALFMSPLLAHHHPAAVEVFAYSDVLRPDAVTARLQPLVAHWRHTVGLSDEALAQQIRDDRVDVLVDLTMHMADHRLLMFARRPAPVQVTWLAYPGTTGVGTFDARLSDPFLDPTGSPLPYTERTIRLPDTFWCYDPLTRGPEVSALPALQNGYVTFSCLNNLCKVNEEGLSLWAAVMRDVPESRLRLLSPRGVARQRVLGILQRHGIAGERVEFADFLPRLQYLEQYQSIDLGLDTLPYNGHTTSLDSLWMGVPVVTLIGPTVVGRAGWSMLSNLGLAGSFAASSKEQFVERATTWARDLQALAELRSGLRARMAASPLMDASRFARGIEAVYRELWVRWCTEHPA